jgi:hypothetical protein
MCKDGKPIYADNTCDISVSGSMNTYAKNVLSPWYIKAKNRQFPTWNISKIFLFWYKIQGYLKMNR